MIGRRNFIVGAGALVLSGAKSGALMAEGHTVHEVMMYSKDPADTKRKMVFTPDILEVNAGDVVKFVSAQKSHNSASIKGMLPEGAEKWKGRINKDVEIKLHTSDGGFFAKKKSNSFEESIDLTSQAIRKQIIKYKQK